MGWAIGDLVKLWRTCLAVLLLSAGCAQKQTFEEPIILDPAVQASLPAVIGDSRPKQVLVSISSEKKYDNWNYAVFDAQTQMWLSPEDSGLWQLGANVTRANGSASGVQQLSLCGLVPLLSTADTTKRIMPDSLIPLGTALGMMMLNATSANASRWRAKNFTTTAKHVCMPEPGEAFSYHYEVDTALKSANPFIGSRTGALVQDVSCRADPEVRPAAELAGPFRGDALTVTCERSDGRGGATKIEYAFLRDSAFYLPLREIGPQVTVTTRYSAAAYRP